MEKPAIDLNYYDWKVSRGQLTLFGTWLLTDKRKQPCLVIIRNGEERSAYTVPCIIPIDRAWIWDVRLGDATSRTYAAFEFCQALRLETTRKNLASLMSLIDEHLEDFLGIPPYSPPIQPKVIGEVAITDVETGQVLQTEVRDGDV